MQGGEVALALWQAHHVADRLAEAGFPADLHHIVTKGDRILDVPLAKIGDKGLFTHELDQALLRGDVHLAVHSLKDLPTTLPEGLVLAAITERASAGDAFVAHPSFTGTLDDLPEGAVIATSSLRRAAQLRAWRPDLRIVDVRGNVGTRLKKLDASDWHGMVLAVAGLERLAFGDRIRQEIPRGIMLPAVGQGALGIVCAEANAAVIELMQTRLHHAGTAAAALAERAFLRRLEGGCQVPIGASAVVEAGTLRLEGVVASLDGSVLLREGMHGPVGAPEHLGTSLAEAMIANGANRVLDAVRAAS